MASTLPISMHKFRQESDKSPPCIPWAATPLDARRARKYKLQKSRGRPLPLFQTLVWGRRLRSYGCIGLKSGAILFLIRTFPQTVETYPLSPLRKCPPRPFAYNYVVLAHNLIMCSQSHPPVQVSGLSPVQNVSHVPGPYPLNGRAELRHFRLGASPTVFPF